MGELQKILKSKLYSCGDEKTNQNLCQINVIKEYLSNQIENDLFHEILKTMSEIAAKDRTTEKAQNVCYFYKTLDKIKLCYKFDEIQMLRNKNENNIKTVEEQKLQELCWWNDELHAVRSLVRKLRKTYQKERDLDRRETKLHMFKILRNVYNKLIRDAKMKALRDYMDGKIEGRLWKGADKLLVKMMWFDEEKVKKDSSSN